MSTFLRKPKAAFGQSQQLKSTPDSAGTLNPGEGSGEKARFAHDFGGMPVFPSGNLEEEADRVAMRVFGGRSFLQEKARVAAAPERDVSGDERVPDALRKAAEPLLGFDFSSVRLRGATSAEQSAAPVDTLASTRGNTISFFPGSYQPHLPLGQALIAHELTHVAQQRAAPALPGRGRDMRASLAHGIADFRAEYPVERLADAHHALADDSGLQPLSSAPSGMQQLSLGCSSSDTSSETAPETAPAAAPPVTSPAGVTARGKAKALVDEQATAKLARDPLDAALAEIRKGAALEYHAKKTPDVIKRAAKALGVPEAGLLSEWDWFLKNGPPAAKPRADDKLWKSHRDTFRAHFQSALDKMQAKHPQSQGAYFLKNTPANVFSLIVEVATPMIPPAFLYVLAGVEGLVDVYIRGQVPGAASPDRLNETELAGIDVTKPVVGYQALGLDTFFTELEYKRKPLSGFFPSGFDQKKVTESHNKNEFETPVRSANAPDLKTALQALLAMISRRQALFQDDRAKLGYPAPSNDELVYFSYVYYNTGPGDPTKGDGKKTDNGGFQTLSRHRPQHPTVAQRRTLGEWIRLKDYPNAIKLLQTYQDIIASGVLKGY